MNCNKFVAHDYFLYHVRLNIFYLLITEAFNGLFFENVI